ncbi:single-stranded DNA-binding protein [Calidithermus roseus]|uniref:Single-stranded DNA-binding protein DdrB n=1 Tax=Calidithermus roseus TaxID=1644118 RepID=A0A399EG76_9DEIN|nr:single-stranded DNA-binding protein [Calidithermus roseus]RIH81242.1 Single-stranded DNA-binding protein DdrB [Calidithermus roseus]
MHLRLHLTSPLGHGLELEATAEDYLELLREWGAKGYRPAPPPPGGYVLPLACAGCFDWAFLGARELDSETVEAFGFRWRRRHLAGRRDLPEVVKFSRGAWQFEEEGVEGKRQGYVTLVRFEGPGDCGGTWCRAGQGGR